MAYPNVFITIAPAEWRFPLHYGLFQHWKHGEAYQHPQDLSKVQGLLTLHIHNVLTSVVEGFLKDKQRFDEMYEYVVRVEFQEMGNAASTRGGLGDPPRSYGPARQ